MMVPRTEMVALPVGYAGDEVAELARAVATRGCRSIARASTTLSASSTSRTCFQLVAAGGEGTVRLVREALTVPETLGADDLLSEMRRRGCGMRS